MELLTSLGQLEGKTIQSANFVDMDESVALVFTDNTYAVIDVEFYGDSHDMILSDDIDDHIKKEAGVMSEEEYNNIQAEKEQARQQRKRDAELRQLKALQDKYPDA